MRRTVMATLGAVGALAAALFCASAEEPEGASGPHAQLQGLVGRWELQVRSRAEATEKFVESAGTSDFRSAMGGRYVVEETKTRVAGHDFEWMAFHGYDAEAKAFVSAWIDNASTGIEVLRGTFDGKSRALVYAGGAFDPQEKKTTPGVRWTLRFVDDDHLRVEMTAPGESGKHEVLLEAEGRRARK
jgi:hypothetical protein